ncbi:hypothetical protein MPER_00650, partial [Moniliophthora perniciosa FA553]
DGAPRTLTHGMAMANPTTIEECTSACFNAGYRFAGTEFAAECSTLSLYNYTGTDLPPITAPGGGGGGGSPVFPVKSGLPGTWKYAACYVRQTLKTPFSPALQRVKQKLTVAGTEFGMTLDVQDFL